MLTPTTAVSRKACHPRARGLLAARRNRPGGRLAGAAMILLATILGAAIALAPAAGADPGASNASGMSPRRSASSMAILSSNERTAFEYFLGRGLTAEQAAGIVGNLDQESGMRPKIQAPGGLGRGIAQWQAGGRWDTASCWVAAEGRSVPDNAAWYAGTEHKSVQSLDLQLRFTWYELTHCPNFGLAQLRDATTIEGAVTAFERYFERCDPKFCATETRISYAQQALAAYGCSPAPYPDVSSSSTFCRDVAWLAEQGITNGYDGGGFHPTAPVSRQAMAAFLHRLSEPGTDDPSCATAPYPDVPASSELCGDVAWLKGQGITNGYDDGGGFHPTAAVSRQAMAAFLHRLSEPGTDDPSCATAPYPDVPASSELCGDVAWLAEQGITNGYDDGGFHPTAAVSRQAMAAFLHRLSG